MSLVTADRVAETTTTTGTGAVTLGGAKTGYQSFAAVGNGNTCHYVIAGGSEWEVGIGTYTAAGTTLSRDTVLGSSNGGSLVTFSAGTKDVFVTVPAASAPAESLIARAVTSGSQATVTFSSIPQYFTDLRVVVLGRDTINSPGLNFSLLFNGDTTAGNYTSTAQTGVTNNGTGFLNSIASSAAGCAIGRLPGVFSNAAAVGSTEILIPVYSGTVFQKIVQSVSGDHYGTDGLNTVVVRAFTWKSTAAITSMTFTVGGTAFLDGSVISLYGRR